VVSIAASLGGPATALVAGFSAIWGLVSTGPVASLVRVDPTSVRVTERVRLPGGVGNEAACGGLAAGSKLLWVVGGGLRHSRVLGVSPRSGRVVVRATVPGYAFCASESSAGVFVTTPERGRIVRLDPTTGHVRGFIETHGFCLGVVATPRRLIISCLDRPGLSVGPNDGKLLVIDAASGRVLRRRSGALGGSDVAWRANGGLFEAPPGMAPLLRAELTPVGASAQRALDRARRRVANPFAQTIGYGRAWVANYRNDGTLIAEPIRHPLAP
jgi:hypothetical protein